jgi:hypothetical protein
MSRFIYIGGSMRWFWLVFAWLRSANRLVIVKVENTMVSEAGKVTSGTATLERRGDWLRGVAAWLTMQCTRVVI